MPQCLSANDKNVVCHNHEFDMNLENDQLVPDDKPSSISLHIPVINDWDDQDDEEIEFDIHDGERQNFLDNDNLLTRSPIRSLQLQNRNERTSQAGRGDFEQNSERTYKEESIHVECETDNKFIKIEPLIIDEPGNIAHSTRSVMYQSPNFQRFASDLGPSSSKSIVVSLIMIVVIICITILPIVIHPQSSSTLSNSIEIKYQQQISKNHNNSNNIDVQQAEHSDARCKCICQIPPPIPVDTKNSSKSQSNSTNTTHDDSGKNNSTSTTKKPKSSAQRSLYVGRSLPNHCNCRNIVGPHLQEMDNHLQSEFCSLCECRYQNRNLNTIKRNVTFFMTILFSMSLYMLAQYILKYFRITRRNLPPRLRWLVYQLNESD